MDIGGEVQKSEGGPWPTGGHGVAIVGIQWRAGRPVIGGKGGGGAYTEGFGNVAGQLFQLEGSNGSKTLCCVVDPGLLCEPPTPPPAVAEDWYGCPMPLRPRGPDSHTQRNVVPPQSMVNVCIRKYRPNLSSKKNDHAVGMMYWRSGTRGTSTRPTGCVPSCLSPKERCRWPTRGVTGCEGCGGGGRHQGLA